MIYEIEYTIKIFRKIESNIQSEKDSIYKNHDRLKKEIKSMKFIINVWCQLNKYCSEVLKTESNEKLLIFMRI